MTWMLLMRLLDAIKGWQERRTTIRRLSRLSDHLREDSGLHRQEIESEARGPARPMPASGDRRSRSAARPGRSPVNSYGFGRHDAVLVFGRA